MKILALDISSRAGWALFEGTQGDEKPQLVTCGMKANDKAVKEYGKYPWSYREAAAQMAYKLGELVQEHLPSVIVVEETNKARARYSQKILEFIHAYFIDRMNAYFAGEVVYISTSTWRKTLGLRLTSDEKKANAKLSKAKSKLRDEEGKVNMKALNVEKKRLGIAGKRTWKHVAVDFVNEQYKLGLKQGDNDIADAIALGVAWFKNAPVCDGINERK